VSDETHLTPAPDEISCPRCGRALSARGVCGYCTARFDDVPDIDLRRLRREPRHDDPVQFLVPTNVSACSIIACYAGFVGMCMPFFGLVFAIPAFVCAIVALRRRRKTVSYGSVTSDIRAILGLVFSSIGLLLWGGMALLFALSKAW
jgi:hypothetical protein